jgi:drug/metabolite transporter (DMT)-like permease
MNDNLLVLAYGLLSALAWGSADFNGGLASRRLNIYQVLLLSQGVGIALIFALALLFGEHLPSLELWLLGMLSGLIGIGGLFGLYYSLARGQMNVAAPVTAVMAATLPVIVSIYREGWPAAGQGLGFVLGFLGIWLLASSPNDAAQNTGGGEHFEWRAVAVPMLSGTAFGLFFILLQAISQDQVFMPLVSARVGSLSLLGGYWLWRGLAQWEPTWREGRVWPLLLLSGILDALGNAFYALAAQSGRLDIAALLSSLYPAATVALAVLILREKLTRQHGLGVILALLAIVLIAF